MCRGAHPLLLPLIVRGSNQRRRGCGRGEQLGLLCDPTRGGAGEQHDAAARRGHESWAHAARRRPLSALHSPLATHYTRHSPTGLPHSLSPLTAPPTRPPSCCNHWARAARGSQGNHSGQRTEMAMAPRPRAERPAHRALSRCWRLARSQPCDMEVQQTSREVAVMCSRGGHPERGKSAVGAATRLSDAYAILLPRARRSPARRRGQAARASAARWRRVSRRSPRTCASHSRRYRTSRMHATPASCQTISS